MKALSRKCTAFLLSLTLLLTLAPTALASEALGDDLDLRSTTLNRGAELGEGTFWSNTFSDLRQENYVVYTPNTSVTPIVTYGDYTTATSTVSAAAKRLEEQGLRVVAGINGDYYDTLNGAPLGTVMTDGVLRVASASNYAVGFRADGTAILGAPALAMQVESANTSFSIAAVNQVRYSYGGIYLYTYDFNARRSTGTNAAGYDVVCSAVDGRLSIGEALTLTVDEILPEATDTAVPEGKYVLTANLLSGEENLALLRALAVGDTLTVTVRAADEGWNDVDYMIGALYQLVENGERRAAHRHRSKGRRQPCALHHRRPPEGLLHRREPDAGRAAHDRARLRDRAESGRRRLDDSVRHAAGGRQCRRLQHPLRGQPARCDEPYLPRCVE